MPVSDFMHDGDNTRRLDKIERLVMEWLSGRSLQNASVTVPDTGMSFRGGGQVSFEDGSGIEVNDRGDVNLNDGSNITLNGGTLHMLAEGGYGLVVIGPIVQGPDTSRGFIFSFDNGDSSSIAFSLAGAPGQQFWGLRDNSGNLVASNDSASGNGLARPYVPLRLIPSGEAQLSGTSFWPSHTNTSFTRVMYGFNPVFHPKIEIGVATATAGGGSAEWRLLLNGTDVTGTVSGGGSRVVSIPDWGEGVLPGHTVEFSLELRIAGGGTRAFAQCDKLFARQS